MSSPNPKKPAGPPRTYISSGQVLSSPPLSARLRSSATDVYNFFGLYITTILTLDPREAAANSSFAITNRRPGSANRARPAGGNGPLPRSWGSGGGGGGGSGGGSGGSGSGDRRLGTVDDVRAPECKSCG